ncbi:MAG: PIN domain nuclease, partial [Bacteroidetes bacterium]|nr:PIN domain nuclease [Bacteroidota bacterium]
DFYDFYAPKYIRTEIWEHHEKIKKIAKLNNEEFIEVYELILKNITILNHSIVDKRNYREALELCKNIDIDDTPFVAFSRYLKCKLWTGDKKLIKGLQEKGFSNIITTDELFENFLKKSSNRIKK